MLIDSFPVQFLELFGVRLLSIDRDPWLGLRAVMASEPESESLPKPISFPDSVCECVHVRASTQRAETCTVKSVHISIHYTYYIHHCSHFLSYDQGIDAVLRA